MTVALQLAASEMRGIDPRWSEAALTETRVEQMTVDGALHLQQMDQTTSPQMGQQVIHQPSVEEPLSKQMGHWAPV